MPTANPPESNPPASGTDVVASFKQGQQIGGCYVLERKVESGGVTTIWLARDEVIDKDVSLHFIPEAVRGDARAMEELRQETKRNRQLIHPNILRVYDLVEESEWAAVSMDHFEAESVAVLRQKKHGGFMEVADVKPWFGQLCQTIEDAHRIQLFHRDITPSNIFIESGGRLLLANFGISRCVRDSLARVAGGAAATANASPQQLDHGRAAAADDIYAAGILMHELLAGRAPLSGDGLAEKIRKTTPPTMMENRTQSGKGGGPIPPGWEKVITSCLDKSADGRPKSFTDLATRLGFSKGKSVEVATEPEAEAVPTPTATPVSAAAEVVAAAIVQPAAEAAPAILEKESEPSPTPVAAAPADAPEPQPSMKKPSERFVPDHNPDMKPRRSGFPITGLAAAILLFVLSIYGLFFRDGDKKDDEGTGPDIATETSPVGVEPVTISEPVKRATPAVAAAVRNATPSEPVVAKTTPRANVEPVAKIESRPPVVGAIATPVAPLPMEMAAAKATPAPPKTATPAPVAPAAMSTTVGGSPDANLAAKAAALDAAKKNAEAAVKAHQDSLKLKEMADAAAADAKKALEEKTKAALPVLKAAEDIVAMRKQREEEMRAADLAAQEAQKLAAEKTRVVEEAKKAIAKIENDSKDKIAAMQKAASDLNDVKQAVADKEKLAAEALRLADAAKARQDEQAAAVKQSEMDYVQAKSVADKMAEENAKKAAEMEAARKAIADKKTKLEKEMDDARKGFEARMKELEAALKTPDDASAPAVPHKTEAPVKEEAPIPVKPQVPPPLATQPPPPVADPALMVKAEPPKVTAVAIVKPEDTKPMPAPGGGAFSNSLGMKFVPVGDVDFCTIQTRVKDFEAFAAATGLKSNLWRDPGFKQAPDHPVVNVTWMEAIAFCKWLTFKEQREGVLQANQTYRLPTDLEWSKAVGLPEESGKTPEARDMGIPDVYPWGTQWPPPPGAGNYTGEETGSDVAIKGFEDGFPWTAPVGSFPPNKYGLYDMGGNVWQWVMDPWAGDPKSKALRGASWYNGALKLSLLSSCRVHAAQDSSTDNYGFRVVLANDGGKPGKR